MIPYFFKKISFNIFFSLLFFSIVSNELMKWMRIYGVVWYYFCLDYRSPTASLLLSRQYIYFIFFFFFSFSFHIFILFAEKIAVVAYVRCSRMRCIMCVWHAIWFCSLAYLHRHLPTFSIYATECGLCVHICVCVWPTSVREWGKINVIFPVWTGS